jgi:YidC/Oxa1 family membrane protein insertase
LAPASVGDAQVLSLANQKLKTEVNTRGGLFGSAILTEYNTYHDSVPVRLWDESQSSMAVHFAFPGGGEISLGDLYFSVVEHRPLATESSPALLSLRADGAGGTSVSITHTLAADAYDIKTEIGFKNLDSQIATDNNSLRLEWNAVGLAKEKGIQSERQQSSVFFCPIGEKRDYLSESSEDEETTEQDLRWVAFKQHFFSAIVIADKGFAKGSFVKSFPAAEDSHTMHYQARLPLLSEKSSDMRVPLNFYFGPNEFRNLKAMDVENLDRIIDYGWTIFGWVNRWFVRPMFVFLSEFIGNYGIIILLLTIAIKLLLFPITWKNYLSSAKMKVLKPEIDEINKKYEGKDGMEKQQAVMALYRQTGVNPFAGCIPMLLQMPILYAMFRFFPASIELRGQGFLWADDLGAYDVLIPLGMNIPLYGSHVSGFTVLMAISMFFYTRVSAGSMPDTSQPGMPNMKIIMNIFPFMMLFIFNSLSSGLSFYYFAANVISIGQMLAIKKYFIDEDKIKAKIEDNKKKPKKKSAFQERLEQIQRDQKQKLAEQKKKK